MVRGKNGYDGIFINALQRQQRKNQAWARVPVQRLHQYVGCGKEHHLVFGEVNMIFIDNDMDALQRKQKVRA